MADYVEVKGVKVRVGDRVRWVSEGVVKKVDAESRLCPLHIDNGKNIDCPYVSVIQSLEVLPPAIKVGDMVLLDGFKMPLEVLAALSVDGVDWLVCKTLAGNLLTNPLADCTKVTPA
jgi:hypothetical protein